MTLNKKQRQSLIAFCYKMSELLIAGIGLTGIIQQDPKWGTVVLGIVLALGFLALGLVLEDDDQP